MGESSRNKKNKNKPLKRGKLVDSFAFHHSKSKNQFGLINGIVPAKNSSKIPVYKRSSQFPTSRIDICNDFREIVTSFERESMSEKWQFDNCCDQTITTTTTTTLHASTAFPSLSSSLSYTAAAPIPVPVSADDLNYWLNGMGYSRDMLYYLQQARLSDSSQLWPLPPASNTHNRKQLMDIPNKRFSESDQDETRFRTTEALDRHSRMDGDSIARNSQHFIGQHVPTTRDGYFAWDVDYLCRQLSHRLFTSSTANTASDLPEVPSKYRDQGTEPGPHIPYDIMYDTPGINALQQLPFVFISKNNPVSNSEIDQRFRPTPTPILRPPQHAVLELLQRVLLLQHYTKVVGTGDPCSNRRRNMHGGVHSDSEIDVLGRHVEGLLDSMLYKLFDVAASQYSKEDNRHDCIKELAVDEGSPKIHSESGGITSKSKNKDQGFTVSKTQIVDNLRQIASSFCHKSELITWKTLLKSLTELVEEPRQSKKKNRFINSRNSDSARSENVYDAKAKEHNLLLPDLDLTPQVMERISLRTRNVYS